MKSLSYFRRWLFLEFEMGLVTIVSLSTKEILSDREISLRNELIYTKNMQLQLSCV